MWPPSGGRVIGSRAMLGADFAALGWRTAEEKDDAFFGQNGFGDGRQ